MGLAGGIVRRVLSKSPCTSAGHSGRGPGDHRRRWTSLRMYLCGDEAGAAAAGQEADENDDDDNGTVASAGSFETCPTTRLPAGDRHGDVNSDGADSSNPGELRGNVLSTEAAAVGEEEAATLIQTAFRRLMARRRLLRELKASSVLERCCAEEEPARSPASASIAASVEVQVGESLSNLRLSDDGGASPSPSAQLRASQKARPPQAFRAKEEWDDSTLSSNVLRMRIQSRMEATTRRERALAYAFSQQLRSGGGGTKKRSSRSDQGEFNVGWSWLERWMATRQAEPADDCASKNAADAGSAAAGRRVVVAVRRRQDVAAVEEKESCGSNDVSAAVSFDGSSAGGRSGSLSCYRPGKNSRLRGARNLPRRKVAAAASDHGLQARSSRKVSKKARQREKQLQKDHHQPEADAEAYDPRQPPTDY